MVLVFAVFQNGPLRWGVLSAGSWPMDCEILEDTPCSGAIFCRVINERGRDRSRMERWSGRPILADGLARLQVPQKGHTAGGGLDPRR